LSARFAGLAEQPDQPLFERIEIAAEFTRRSGVHELPPGDHADLVTQAADFVRIVAAEEGGDALSGRERNGGERDQAVRDDAVAVEPK
jgi:hypothetical protein